MMNKSVSIKQLLDARDDMIDHMFYSINNVYTSHHHVVEHDMKVKEIYGFWFKTIVKRDGRNFRLSVHSLGMGLHVLDILESAIGTNRTPDDVRKEAGEVVDAWLSRVIKMILRTTKLQVEGDRIEVLHEYADMVKELYPKILIHINHNGFSYHCMTNDGELLTSTSYSSGAGHKTPHGRLALAKLEDYTLFVNDKIHADGEITTPHMGVSAMLADTVITDFANLIMLGEPLMLNSKIEYDIH